MASIGRVTVEIENGTAFAALISANQLAKKIVEDQPWNDDAKLLVEELAVASRGLKTKESKRKPW